MMTIQGDKPHVVCASEADNNGALTMMMLHLF